MINTQALLGISLQLIIIILISAFLPVICALFRVIKSKEGIALIFSLSLLGAIIGYLTAFSREPILEVTLPAFLSLIAGFQIFASLQSKGSQQISLAIIALSINLFLGSQIGGGVREQDYANRLTRILTHEAKAEYMTRQLRKGLQLPEINNYRDYFKKEHL